MSKMRSLALAGMVTVVLSLGVVVAACGSDNNDNNGGEPTQPAATESMETPTESMAGETPTEAMAGETPSPAATEMAGEATPTP